MSRLIIHPAFEPLMGVLREQPDYSIANLWGGRGGMKSEQTGKCALAIAMERPTRVLFFRETQASIRDSSHKLLSDAIFEHGLSVGQNGHFEVQASRIIRSDGERIVSEFIFAGVREDPMAIKSLKGINLAVGEEAGELTSRSIEILEPTVLREAGAKLWYVWNPGLVSDPIYQHLMKNPPPATIHINTSYLDNPWLSETMRVQAEHMRMTDPKRYAHIWLGEANEQVEGAVYAKELQTATDEKRIVGDPGIGIDRTKPVHTYWDLGHGDATAIWFCQSGSGWFNLVDYYENAGVDLTHYANIIRSKGYTLGTCWLPWDGVSARTHHKLTGSIERSPEQVMRSLGFQVRLAADSGVDNGISAVRLIFPQLRFNEPKCRDGLAHLRRYQWGPKIDKNGAKMVQMKPQHDEHSHGADALRTLAISAREAVNSQREEKYDVWADIMNGGGNGAGWRA